MGIAFHKPTAKSYTSYTVRMEDSILSEIRKIASKEDLSINETINQCLRFSIEDYKKNKSNKK